jgi:hypothetical protein
MKILVSTALLLLLTIGCGGDEEEPNIDVESCELIAAAATPVTANTDKAAAPAIAPGETAYELTLSAMDKTYVNLTIAEAGEYAYFLSQDNVASGKYFSGMTEKTLEAGSANENCAAAIPDHYHVAFDAPGMYAFELNPSAAKVKIVVHPDEDHGH